MTSPLVTVNDSVSGESQKAGIIRTPATAKNIEAAAVYLDAAVLNFMSAPISTAVNAFICDFTKSMAFLLM
jgi:hypothetical protein